MVNRWTTFFITLLFLACSLAMVACEEDPPEITIPAFDRAQDVALVCYDTEDNITLPISCCRSDGMPVEEECGVGLPFAELFAFVTQTTIGEVAVVNMKEFEIIDQEVGIPYASFIPVGGQPSDIIATTDSRLVITANFETGDLSVITVVNDDMSVIHSPSLTPSLSIDLGGPAAKMALVKKPSGIADKYILVTQPTMGRVAIVSLDPDLCDGSSVGCMVGYLTLREETEEGSEEESDEDMDAGVSDGGIGSSENSSPWPIEASKNTPSVFVGILGAPSGREIAEINSEILINELLSTIDAPVSEPVELSLSSVVRYIDTGGKEVAALSLEPEVEKWMYGIDNEEGDLFVINLRENELETLEDGSTSIEIPGRAIALKLFRAQEGLGSYAPFVFNGTFGVVSSTIAGFFVIDVDDNNADPDYPHPHSIRSFIDYEESPPALFERPGILYGSTDAISAEDAIHFVYFENDVYEWEDEDAGEDIHEADGGVSLPDCDPNGADGGPLFSPDYIQTNHGFRFRCDDRESSKEDWLMEWEGYMGIRGAAVLVDDSSETERLIRDETMDFCYRGLRLDIRIPEAEEGEPGSGSGHPQTYLGDILVITSEPTPANENSECSFFEDYQDNPARYKIEKVVGEHELIINNSLPLYGDSSAAYPMPTEECFGQAFSYEIRSYNHWILLGGNSGRMYEHGSFDPEEETCIPDPDGDELRTSRVFRGVQFANYYFTFKMFHGENFDIETGSFVDPADTEEDTEEQEYEPPDKPYVAFSTHNGYIPMFMSAGSNVTDIELTPETNLVLVDQAHQGLSLFSVYNFGFIGRPVY